MTEKYYLAYGSNLNMAQMTYRCRDAVKMGTTMIKDYRLMYKGSKTGAYLTIEPAKGYVVPVGVWAVSERDEKSLDIYEGYPNFYYKKKTKLRINGDEPREVDAFVYIMHEDRPLGIPSNMYVNTCRQGYRDFGFDEKILDDAYQYSISKYKPKKVSKK